MQWAEAGWRSGLRSMEGRWPSPRDAIAGLLGMASDVQPPPYSTPVARRWEPRNPPGNSITRRLSGIRRRRPPCYGGKLGGAEAHVVVTFIFDILALAVAHPRVSTGLRRIALLVKHLRPRPLDV